MTHNREAGFLAAVVFFMACCAGAAEVNLLPNSGFEISGHMAGKRVRAMNQQGMTFESDDPALPLRWKMDPSGTVDVRLPFFRDPTAIRFGAGFSGYAWSGVFDEVRLSDVQRYGPFVPVDTEWKPRLALQLKK